MLHIFIPAGYTSGDLPTYTQSNEVAQTLARAGQAVMCNDDAMRTFYAVERNVAGVRMSMNRPQKARPGTTLILKWNVCKGERTFVWGGDIKFEIKWPSLAEPLPPVNRYKTAKASMLLSDEDYAADISLLEIAAKILTSTEGMKHGQVPENCINVVELNTNISKQFEPTLLEARKAHQDQEAKKLADDKHLRDLMSSLPDGTPLIVRSSGPRSPWQLGLKQGRMSLTMARNTKIVPSEVLRSEEMQQAGLSMHDILYLDVAARAAAQAHPEATKFMTGDPNLHPNAVLHPGQPFHVSYLKDKTQPETAAMLSTIEPSCTGVSFRRTQEYMLRNNGVHGQSTNQPPPPTIPSTIVEIKAAHRWKDDAVPRPFSKNAGLWCLSKDAAAVLAEHNIGTLSLHPLHVLDEAGKHIGKDWTYICMESPVDAVLEGLCDPDALTVSGRRDIKPYEIVIDTTKVEGLDLWWDTSVRNGQLFFSERLVKALKRAKVLPHAGLKPCIGA